MKLPPRRTSPVRCQRNDLGIEAEAARHALLWRIPIAAFLSLRYNSFASFSLPVSHQSAIPVLSSNTSMQLT